MTMNNSFWKKKKVLITGDTGFKGAWLAYVLNNAGAIIQGLSSSAFNNNFQFYESLKINKISNTIDCDVRDLEAVKKIFFNFKPEFVFHLAAQPLVRESYRDPINTFNTNIMGTINLFEASKRIDSLKAIVVITSDKCYENNESSIPFVENDKLGGYDPYSCSKACVELISKTYRKSFFNKYTNVKIATTRAGNVIGGGDWAIDRLVPDFFRSINLDKKMSIRSPNAVRPWQHVLEPIMGYLILSEKLVEVGKGYDEAWNFGPNNEDSKTVSWIVEYLSQKLSIKHQIIQSNNLHEANLLFLNSSKARSMLGWNSKWSVNTALDKTIEWYLADKKHQSIPELTSNQINSYIVS